MTSVSGVDLHTSGGALASDYEVNIPGEVPLSIFLAIAVIHRMQNLKCYNGTRPYNGVVAINATLGMNCTINF